MVGFLDTDEIHRMKRDEMDKFSASGPKTSGILMKNPKRVRVETGSKRYRKISRNMRGWGGSRERIHKVGGRRVGCL